MKDDNPCIPHQLASPTACFLPDLDLASTPQQYTRRAYATHKKCLHRGFTRGRVCTQREFKPGEVTRAGFKQEPVLAIWFSSITLIFTNRHLHDDDDDDKDHGILMHAAQLRPKAVYICEILHFDVAKMLNHNCGMTPQKVMLKKISSSAHHFAHGDTSLAQTDLSECDELRTMKILEA